MADAYDKQKETAGGWAAIVWLASGLFLYLTTKGASLLSWSALFFVVVGMFAAAIVFGITFYLLQRGIAKALLNFITEPTQGAAAVIRYIGVVLLMVETVVVYLAASWVFHSFFPSAAG